MASYSPYQLDEYFAHIRFPRSAHPPASDPLTLLTAIQAHHLARVPFESLTLHYSKHHLLSLDPEDLFHKIVGASRGGYCMEQNTFFGAVLRSMGFALIHAGGRVKTQAGWTGMSHMVNIVTIDGQRYLVDVGFGSNGPMSPVPLTHGQTFDQIAPIRGELTYGPLAEHSDPSQKIWIYSTSKPGTSDSSEESRLQYCFLDAELFPADFEVMNLSTMTHPTSLFVKTVVAMRTILDEGAAGEVPKAIGVLTLIGDVVKRRIGGETEVLETLKTESERIRALKKWFEVVISKKDANAIRGLGSELAATG